MYLNNYVINYNNNDMLLSRYKKYNTINNIYNNEKNINYSSLNKFSITGVSAHVSKLSIYTKDKKELKNNNTVVYKLSNEVDFLIDHESFVLSELNKLKIPHFVKYYTITDDIDIVKNDTNSRVLLMEHLYSHYQPECLTFYNILKNNKDDEKGENIIVSQILQVLMALEISQNELSFTHYDLHMDNVLELECEPNSVFLYELNINNEKEYYVVPTFGYYPVIIDVGMSYVCTINDKPMLSPVHNYLNGSQCCIFDTFNDIHHLLISSFYYIEDCNENYDKISKKLKSIFSNVPVLRKRGWKQLKYNIDEELYNVLIDNVENFDDDIFDHLHMNIIGLISSFVKLPLQENKHDDEITFDSFYFFFKEVKYIYMNVFNKSEEYLLLNIIKIIVKTFNDSREGSNFKSSLISNLENLKNIFDISINKKNFENIEFNDLYKSCIDIGLQLSYYYYNIVNENTKVIIDGYNKINEKYEIYSPLDFFYYFYENLTPHFQIDEDTIIYSFENEMPIMRTCKVLNKDQLYRINKSSYLTKGNLLQEYLSNIDKLNKKD